MPNPKLGTVTQDVATAVKNAKSGQIKYKNDKAGIVHAGIGKLNFKEEDLQAFFNHPNEAAKLSKQFSSYSDIDYIVESQHELPNRKGFPNRPSSSKLTQICAVFNTSQYVAAEIDGESPNNNHYAKIIKTMSKDFATGTFKETLNLLKNSLKVNEKKVS